MSRNSKKSSSVVTHAKDDYKFVHTTTTKSTYTDADNQRHSITSKEVTHFEQSRPQRITAGSSISYNKAISSPHNRAAVTQTSKTTFRGPNNQSYTFHDRNYHSSIQKQSYKPPTAQSGDVSAQPASIDYNYFIPSMWLVPNDE